MSEQTAESVRLGRITERRNDVAMNRLQLGTRDFKTAYVGDVSDLLTVIHALQRLLYRACVEVDPPEGVVLDHATGTAHIEGSEA